MIEGMTRETIDGIELRGVEDSLNASLTKVHDNQGLLIYDLEIDSNATIYVQPVTVVWKIPAINVKGVWKPTTDFSKRIEADWELDHMESRISIDAPVISLFGHDDANILTFACSNAINKLELNAQIREEDNQFYCHITFFTERHYPMTQFSAQIRLDYRKTHFSNALKDVSKWWESYEALKPATVPSIAKMPLYSTWYQFHQNLDEATLLKECKLAYDLGYKSIIIDDGWQTNDSNRGYDYTGDWQPERIPNMANFVKDIHDIGMKVGLWYSVPFCGKHSEAYKRFKGKFLTENHRWAPVFDPRYPEVRDYLINTYVNALRSWDLDGFKLDFIDDFKVYPDTPFQSHPERDHASVNEAVDHLMTDIINALKDIKPEVFIEFRQKYTGPAMRKYGNMFRAFDCPGDATMNRIRIADIKMLCGDTAVHSDMVTWHPDEPIEIAALQIINTLFGVPQLSVMLHQASEEELDMIGFYTNYWNNNCDVLMQGEFIPTNPLANYPIQQVTKDNHTIIGVHEDQIITLDKATDRIDILNAQLAKELVIRVFHDLGSFKAKIFDCKGNVVSEDSISLAKGLTSLDVPPCGIIQLTKN